MFHQGHPDSGESYNCAKNGPTSSPVGKICHLQYANFVLLVGDAAKEATDSCVQNFVPGCCGT